MIIQRLFIIICFNFFHMLVIGQGKKPPVILGELWKDTEGNIINAHGAGLLYFGDTYYMYGEIKKGITRLVPGQNWGTIVYLQGGVSCYSSKDLQK